MYASTGDVLLPLTDLFLNFCDSLSRKAEQDTGRKAKALPTPTPALWLDV